jgi:membrane-associated protease RseP (regulator of RpoE activity)
MGLLGILAFIFALLASVMIHEAGHYLTAKGFGMKVTEFFLGFGKRLWSTQRGETEFGIKAIPAGGYCRIVGMSSREELPEADAPRAFYKASAPKRLIVLGAGSFLHFVLGYLLIFAIFFGVGTTALTSTVNQVVPCINAKGAICSSHDLPSPAKAAGILPGDTFIAINGYDVTDWNSDVNVVRNSPGKTNIFSVQRGDQRLEIPITSVPYKVNGKTIGMIGVINKLGMVRSPFSTSLRHSATLAKELFTGSLSSLVQLPSKVPALVRQTFGGEKRDPAGLVGVIGVAEASAQTAGNASLAWNERIATFLLIIASHNIFVGIFNLLPLLPLDGGHMAIAVMDGLRNTYARLRGRSLPRPIDVESLTPLTLIVFVFLAALSVLLLAADIFNPVHFNL